MKSRYKHLVVSGCSFTSNYPSPPDSPWNWPNMLAQYTGMTVHNLGIPGAGNSHISNSIMLYLEREKLSPDDTLVIAMWTGVGRIDWITDKELSKFCETYPFPYSYNNNCEAIFGGSLGSNTGLKRSNIGKLLLEFTKYQSDDSLALTTWLSIQNLENYLKNKKYRYYFTSYLNLNVDTSTASEKEFLWIPLNCTLRKNNLHIDYSNWLDIGDENYYGEWAQRNKLLSGDNWHPGANATERWPKEIVMPYLKQQGILYDK